jgi:hypothetical protein
MKSVAPPFNRTPYYSRRIKCASSKINPILIYTAGGKINNAIGVPDEIQVSISHWKARGIAS